MKSVYAMNRVQMEAEARDLGIKDPQNYNLPELRVAVKVKRGQLSPTTKIRKGPHPR